MTLESLEIVDVRRIDDATATQRRRRHDDRIRERRAFDRAERLPSGATERRRHVFDNDRGQNFLTDVAPSTPPLDVDDRGHNREKSATYDISECFGRTLFAPLERDQHSRVERERHAAFRRLFLGEATACHSASIRSMASEVSGGMPYFSK